MKGRTPTEEEKDWMDDICQFGCIVCYLEFDGLYTPPQIHHIHGKTRPGAHKKTIPLCYNHHMADQQNPPSPLYTSRHPNKAAFEKRYGTEQYLLEMTEKLIFEQQGVIF